MNFLEDESPAPLPSPQFQSRHSSRTRRVMRPVFIGCETVAIGLIVALNFPEVSYVADIGLVYFPVLALPFVSVAMLVMGYRFAGVIGLITTGGAFVFSVGAAIGRGC